MADEGADLLDVGGESTRPGHAAVDADEEPRRVVPVVRAIRDALPAMPLTIDTTKPGVAEAALDAGAGAINDVWGVSDDDTLARVAADRGVPIILMHNRAEPRYRNLVPEVVGDLQRAIDRALAAGVPWEDILVDPGIRVRQDAGAEPRAPGRAREPAPPRPPDRPRHLAQVDARQGPRPAARGARRGNGRHDGARDRGGGRRRARPRRPRERPRRADGRRA